MYSQSSRFIIPFSIVVIIATIGLLLFLFLNDIGGDGVTDEEETTTNLGEAIGDILESDQEFEITEVVKHNLKEDCYVIIEEEVFDFTESFSKEPNLIESNECGTDITALARSMDKEILEEYHIGNLIKTSE